MKHISIFSAAIWIWMAVSFQAYAFENVFCMFPDANINASGLYAEDAIIKNGRPAYNSESEILIKNMYADFLIGKTNVRVGTQSAILASELLFSKEDYYFISPSIKLGDISVNPYLMYQMKNLPSGSTDDKSDSELIVKKMGGEAFLEDYPGNIYFLGIDFDARLNAANAWFTGIYEKGEEKNGKGGHEAFLVAAGGGVDLGNMGFHGQAFYAAGKDPKNKDNAYFLVPKGASYSWSEILGNGIYNNSTPEDNPSDITANIMALNLGASHKPIENITVKADIWYALLAEPGVDETTQKKKPGDLGTEIDITVSYEVIKGLNLDVMAAYLIAGEATGTSDNPMELGTQLSLDF
ncbi:MAG: hypothetical protein KJ737_14090 [Proteobacteria bacterium]|nr:hypothetical protein [Pseudomonadota bacterium]